MSSEETWQWLDLARKAVDARSDIGASEVYGVRMACNSTQEFNLDTREGAPEWLGEWRAPSGVNFSAILVFVDPRGNTRLDVEGFLQEVFRHFDPDVTVNFVCVARHGKIVDSPSPSAFRTPRGPEALQGLPDWLTAIMRR